MFKKPSSKLLMSGSVLRVVNLAAQAATSFLLTPFVIHSLGDRMNGFWVFVGTFIGYYGLADLGLGWAVSRFVGGALGKGDQEECRKIFSAAMQLYTALGIAILAFTLGVAFLAPMFAHEPQEAFLFRKVVVILGLSFALSFPVRAYSGLLTAELRLDVLAATEILCLVLRTGLVVAVLGSGHKIVALAWVTFLSGLPRMAIYFLMARKQCPWLRFQRQPWLGQATKSLLSYSAVALIAKTSDQLRFNADAFVVTAFVGLAAVTHFNIAAIMAKYYMDLMIALVGFLLPLFSRLDGAGDTAALERTFLFATKLSVSAAAFVAFGLVAWGRPFIERWMGPAYKDAYPCLAVLALGWLTDLAQIPSNNMLFAVSKHKFYALANTVEGVANLVLSIYWVKKFGIWGVAMGTAVPMMVVRLLILPAYVCRVCSFSLRDYSRAALGALFMSAIGLLLPAAITLRFVGPRYPNLVFVGCVSLAIYVAVVWFAHFTRSEREILERALTPGWLGRFRGFAAATEGLGRTR
jgi:O-antigen/teichoic acid export membrane protein